MVAFNGTTASGCSVDGADVVVFSVGVHEDELPPAVREGGIRCGVGDDDREEKEEWPALADARMLVGDEPLAVAEIKVF